MKTKNLINALKKITKPVETIEGNTTFINGDRRVTVIDQNGSAIGLPIIGSQVVHNGNYTIKNLVSFLIGGAK